MLIKNKEIENEYIRVYSLIDEVVGIPIFQRFYDWKETQTKQLLEDIVNAINNDKQLYLLDFIYYKENKKVMLADGQQRIVTLNLLIKAINDIITENDLKIDKLQQFDIHYDILVNDEKYQKTFTNFVVAPFKKVYLFLYAFVKEHIDHIEDIKKIITDRIFIYFKKCANVDDAFQIFQQINTGGKPLSKDEIIKTALDQYSIIYEVKIDTLKIKRVRQDLISYYKFVENDYNANFDNMAIMSFLNKYVTDTKEHFQGFKDSVDLLNKLEGNPLTSIVRYINRPSLFDVINVMAMKNIDLNVNKEYVNKVLIPLCFASITLTFNGGNPVLMKYLSNELIKMLKSDVQVDKISLYIANYINENSQPFKMTLASFTNALGDYESNYQNIKKALLILDVMHKNTAGLLNVESINLEHIYPQRPEISWATKGWPTSHDEQLIIINNIGNYLLLNEEVNKKIKNKYITDKVSEYEKIIPNDLMLQTEVNTVDFKEFETRKMDYITERQSKIARNLKKDLPFGDVLIQG